MGCGGTGGGLPGLLPLDSKHPDLQDIFRSGDVEDDFEIEKEPIARGKFASVRLACHRITKEIYAAKYIRRRRRASNLEEEARHEVAVLLLGRSDPHIVHMHQVYETRTEYIIILEFGAGGDLQRLLDDQGRFQENTVKELLIQILKGLHFLHQHHIAHLDIKPQNLVLMGSSTEEGLKLVDFGLSRLIQQDTELTQIMGTPDYVAPEVINFECVNLATDMWSIGVLTYVFLSGYTPFGGDTDQETFVNITQGEFDFPDEYFTDASDQSKDFISSLLTKNPAQRMTVEQCFSHPWLSNVFVPHRMLQLEPDSVDSGYSTDHCNGSPPSPDSLSSGYVSDLYQCSIPEESSLSCNDQFQPIPSFRHFDRLQFQKLEGEEMDRIINNDEKRSRLSSSHLSINVLDCIEQSQRPQARPLRRSSLFIPRNGHEKHIFEDASDYNANRTLNSLYSPNYCNHTSSTSNLSWNHNSQLEHNPSVNQFEQNTLLNLTRPWKNLCNGSYTRALNQLNNKSSPKIKNSRTNLGLHPDLSCSMFELKPNYDNVSMVQQPLHLKTTMSDIRKSKAELRGSKCESRGSIQELRSSKQDLRGSKRDLSKKAESRGSKLELNGKVSLKGSRTDLSVNSDFRGSKADIRASRADLRGSKTDIHGSRHDLRSSKSDLRISKSEYNQPNNDLLVSKNNNNIMSSLNARTIAHLNMSLSRLDLAQESLDNDEAEKRDVVYSDCTLPRRFSRSTASSLLHGNTFHMSFRKSKKKDGKI